MIAEEKGNNILIIDDEVQVLKSLERQFRRKYNVFIAKSGPEALDIMDRESIQVIISDQRMPGMTGVDFFYRIKDKYKDVSKIILTGYSDIEAVIAAINQGQVFRYVGKPWIPEELETVIKEAFNRSNLISENKKLVAELQEINQNLEEKVRKRTLELEDRNIKLHDLNIEKNKYIGIVAHDLRNPIGNALSFSKLLVDKFESFPLERNIKYLNIINDRCSYSLNLIEGFLDVSKIEAGIFDLNLQPLDYISFVKNVAEQNGFLSQQKSQEIMFKTEISEIILKFDAPKMEQVLNNLISNASKYSPAMTNIYVEVRREGNVVITSIRDEGQGISPDELKDVFNPFQLTSTKSTSNEKSTGLGLAIVKKIVEAHHGKISVKSELKSGSVFSFQLMSE